MSSSSRNEKKHQAIIKQVDRLAWLLDNSIRIPIINYRIGLDAIIGLIPGFGDLAGLLISSVIVLQAVRLGVPRATVTRMLFNITLEATIGVIPIFGDIFDATFKANTRNMTLLKQAIDDSQSSRRRKAAGTRAMIGAIGALVGTVVLLGGVTRVLFRWVTSFFLRE